MSHGISLPSFSPEDLTFHFSRLHPVSLWHTNMQNLSSAFLAPLFPINLSPLVFSCSPSDWSTLVQEKVLLSWTLSCLLACARAPSKAWRPMCSEWILPRSCPHGLICWWRAATMLLSSSRRSPRVRKTSSSLSELSSYTYMFKMYSYSTKDRLLLRCSCHFSGQLKVKGQIQVLLVWLEFEI